MVYAYMKLLLAEVNGTLFLSQGKPLTYRLHLSVQNPIQTPATINTARTVLITSFDSIRPTSVSTHHKATLLLVALLALNCG